MTVPSTETLVPRPGVLGVCILLHCYHGCCWVLAACLLGVLSGTIHFFHPPSSLEQHEGVAEEDPKVGCGGLRGFPSKHLFRGGRRDASVPAEKKKRFVCLLDENILIPALHGQLAASQENVLLCSLAENRAAALGKRRAGLTRHLSRGVCAVLSLESTLRRQSSHLCKALLAVASLGIHSVRETGGPTLLMYDRSLGTSSEKFFFLFLN